LEPVFFLEGLSHVKARARVFRAGVALGSLFADPGADGLLPVHVRVFSPLSSNDPQAVDTLAVIPIRTMTRSMWSP
jgi:hypothetical protein